MCFTGKSGFGPLTLPLVWSSIIKALWSSIITSPPPHPDVLCVDFGESMEGVVFADPQSSVK